MTESIDLNRRLGIFLEAGMLKKIPTRWQLIQGYVEMTPFAISTDVTTEEGYRVPLGHPVLRQPMLLAEIGFDHFNTGSALASALDSVCAHLELTYHRGMPVFDLQVVQTHEGGLEYLRQSFEDLLTSATPKARRRRALAERILSNPDEYFRKFLGPTGWIEQAKKLDYPAPDAEGSALPTEYFSLVDFLNHCSEAFPAQPGDMDWRAYPRHFVFLASRRFREGRGLNWFGNRGMRNAA
jgi:hypothetical protein